MAKKIAILTGGGDCPGLNAVIRAVVKAASRRGWKTIGVEGGFEGLLDPIDIRPIQVSDLDGLLFRGGTILGTSNRGRFAAKTGLGEVRRIPNEILSEALNNFRRMGLDGLIVVGGDGSLTIAQQLFEVGMPIVGVPKTIDNDLEATQMTFGFDSAVTCAVEALDRLHTTAASHKRVMVLETMGRYAGWIALYAGIAGGADVILIPELPYHYDMIVEKINEREQEGKYFTMIIVAEGAIEENGGYSITGEVTDEREARLGGVAIKVAAEIERLTGKETRYVVLGHLQRGGMPTPVDRQLCTRFGVGAVGLIELGKFGQMVALQAQRIVAVPIIDAIGRLKTVPPDGEMVRTASALGISFGCEVPV